MTTAEQTKLREALEAVDSEVVLTGHLKELVDEALAADAASPGSGGEWRAISEHGPWDGQPYRQFVRIEGSRTHHGATWARVYCGEAFVRPPGAPDEMFQYRREDILRLCEHGDIDPETATVTHWMPAVFPAVIRG